MILVPTVRSFLYADAEVAIFEDFGVVLGILSLAKKVLQNGGDDLRTEAPIHVPDCMYRLREREREREIK